MDKETTEKTNQVHFKSTLLEGNITRNIITLSLPIMAANIIANAYNIIDMIFVGRLGPSAVAAVSLGGILMSFTWTVLLGLSIGTSSLIARFYGAQNMKIVSRVTIQSIVIALSISTLLALFGIFGVRYVLELLGAQEDVLNMGVTYTRIVFCGAISLIVLFVINSIFRGSGDVKTPMITLGTSSIINIILDPLLIFGIGPFPQMGVKGAAIATVIGQFVGAFMNMLILYKGYSRIRISNWSLKPDFTLLKTLFFIGIPGAMQNFFYSISGFALMNFVAAYGTSAVAAFGIGLRIDIMVMMPGWALGASVATILGQNLGAKQPDRAEKTAWRGSMLYFFLLLTVCTLLWLGAAQVIRVFNGDPDVVSMGADYIQTVVFGYIFLPLSLILTMSMNGAGYTLAPMIIIAIAALGIKIPAAIVLSDTLNFGIQGLWYAIAGSAVIQAVISASWFSTGRWKLKKVEETG
ncbi:MATE family efflux transporter [candidate division KSB1 bacterium]